MGFFDAFGTKAAEVSEDPFSVPDNTYNVAITEAGVKTFKDIPYFMVRLTIASGKEAGKSASSMHRMIPWTAQERSDKGDHEAMNERVKSNYKREMLSFGISEEGLDKFDPNSVQHCNSLLGIKGTAFIKSQNGFTNFSDFQRTVAAPVHEATAPAQETQEPNEDAIADLMSGF